MLILGHKAHELRVGEDVELSGPVYTVRDATCVRLLAELATTGALPYDLTGATLFFCGPTPPRAGRPFGSVGPTTAARMDEATVALMDAGIVATIGKGARSAAVVDACERTGGLYFGAIGGIAALLARHVVETEDIAYPELGTEALRRFTLDRFPAFVAVDSQGRALDFKHLS
ncbi:MAG: fumarate hydratase C-terminal domain-containing protein [Coriobacteriia bacterium]|nr:fumarate hydratase C-terminal domain-containing protein [Coriobacteriia bacterium]